MLAGYDLNLDATSVADPDHAQTGRRFATQSVPGL